LKGQVVEATCSVFLQSQASQGKLQLARGFDR
jgi:hypothetical protein